MFVTWDENGGFFDHVAPPTRAARHSRRVPDGARRHRQLGRRDRARSVSASACRCSSSRRSRRGGLVSSQVYDHTSTLRFLETRFGRRSAEPQRVAARNHGRPHGARSTSRRPRRSGSRATRKSRCRPAEEVQGALQCTSKAPVTVPPNSKPVQEPGTRGTPAGSSEQRAAGPRMGPLARARQTDPAAGHARARPRRDPRRDRAVRRASRGRRARAPGRAGGWRRPCGRARRAARRAVPAAPHELAGVGLAEVGLQRRPRPATPR